MSNLLGVDEALPPSEFLDNPSGFVKLASDASLHCWRTIPFGAIFFR
jgi:hypothetical protein